MAAHSDAGGTPTSRPPYRISVNVVVSAPTGGKSTISDLRQLSSVIHGLSMFSKLLLRHPNRDISLSTHPQTHPCTARYLRGRTEPGSAGLSEEVRGGHISYTVI